MITQILNIPNEFGEVLHPFLRDSDATTFKFKNGVIISEHREIRLFHRNQPGWEKVWQKIFTTDDSGMSIGISVVEPGGGGESERVINGFIDFVLYGSGILTVKGLGNYEINAGDFIHIPRDIERGFRNIRDTLFVSVFGICNAPSYMQEGVT